MCKGIEPVDLVVTSPPYPLLKCCSLTVDEWLTWFSPRLAAIINVLKPDGVLALNVMFPKAGGRFDYRLFDITGLAEELGLFPVDMYIWEKTNPVPCGNFKRTDIPGWEPVFLFARGQQYQFHPVRKPYSEKSLGKLKPGNKTRSSGVDGSYAGGHSDQHPDGARQSNVLRISSSGDQGRPRAANGSFPGELPRRFILQHTRPGDLVLDPFCGVGTTCREAARTGRRWVGIDNNEAVIRLANEWLK